MKVLEIQRTQPPRRRTLTLLLRSPTKPQPPSFHCMLSGTFVGAAGSGLKIMVGVYTSLIF